MISDDFEWEPTEVVVDPDSVELVGVSAGLMTAFVPRKQFVEPERDAELGALTAVDVSVEPDLTVQSFKDDCDINVIVRRFGVTGVLPGAKTPPFYGDFSNVMSYQEAMNALLDADEAFMQLPSATRRRFDNDPGQLIAFLSDEANRDEAVKLGLVEPKAQSGGVPEVPPPVDQPS